MKYYTLLLLLLLSLSVRAQVDTCDEKIHAVSDTPCTYKVLHLSVDSLPNTSYSWEGPAGFTASGDSVTRAGISAIHTGNYIVTGTRGICTYKDTVNIYVRSTPLPPYIASLNSPVCEGDTLKVTATTMAMDFQFYFYGPQGYFEFAPLGSIAIPNMQKDMEGQYASYQIGVQGCYSDTTYFSVQVDSAFEIHAVSDTPCTTRTLHLSVDSLANAGYIWEGPAGWMALGDSITRDNISTAEAGQYIITGIRGACISKDTLQVFIRTTPPLPTIVYSTSPVCVGDTLKVLAISTSHQYPSFYRDPLDNPLPGSDTLIIPNMQINMSGEYSVYVTSISGCYSDTAYFDVEVDTCTLNVADIGNNKPFIPSLLQSSDPVFKPRFRSANETYKMQVYDQVGKKVFETNNGEGWYRSAYQGLYYYIITRKSSVYKGRIMLL